MTPEHTPPADPVRAALQELVALQQLRQQVGGPSNFTVGGPAHARWNALVAEYHRRKPLAWAAARAALSAPPSLGEAADARRGFTKNEVLAASLDTRRLNWLEKQVVEVRAHLMWGSRRLFIASHFDEEDPDTTSDLRAKIDAALSAVPTQAQEGK